VNDPDHPLRVLVTGGTGNLGTSLVPMLAADRRIASVVAVGRRRPDGWNPGENVEFRAVDLVSDPLEPMLEGVDVVVHLAWQIGPSRDVDSQWRTNVVGSRRLLDAVASSDVGAFVHASSIGAYSPDLADEPVTEDAPTHGVPRHAYSWQKAYVERELDRFELAHPDVRVVRFRPTLLLKQEAAAELRQLFLGVVLPGPLARPQLTAALAAAPPQFQVMHTDDAARAFLEGVVRPVRGAFNLATEAVFGSGFAPSITQPLLSKAADLAWRVRLVRSDPAWIELIFRAPLIDASRARTELEWVPYWTGRQALEELLTGLRAGGSAPTPSLEGDRPPAAGPDPATVTRS
jgi:nucleoside-diphosphate-sugar epimerase